MYTTTSTKRYLANRDANSITITYLLDALGMSPSEGEQYLIDEMRLALGDDKRFIQDAFDVLVQNNDEIFMYMRRSRAYEA